MSMDKTAMYSLFLSKHNSVEYDLKNTGNLGVRVKKVSAGVACLPCVRLEDQRQGQLTITYLFVYLVCAHVRAPWRLEGQLVAICSFLQLVGLKG